MVAKSYQGLPILGEPYTLSGKQYINVQLKSGKTKSVRFYTEQEYEKLYGTKSVVPTSADPYFRPQKDVLGFHEGYIYIFQNGMDEEDEYLKQSAARYCRWWGWCFPSEEPLPTDLPFNYNPIKLYWKDVGGTDGCLYAEEVVHKAVDQILYPSEEGNYIGTIGERLDLVLTVEKAIPLESKYGTSTLHVMRSPTNDVFVWCTTSKSWPVDSTHTCRGTIKDHKIFKGQNQTILTNVRERK